MARKKDVSAEFSAVITDHEKTPPLDPAQVVAEIMLDRALRAIHSGSLPTGLRGYLGIVRTPPAGWTRVIRDAWGAIVCNGDDGSNADRVSCVSGAWAWVVREPGHSTGWAELDKEEKATISYALSRSIPVIGFSPDPYALLPRDLVDAADDALVIDGPTPDDITVAVARLKGRPPTLHLPDDVASIVTPRLLRLAWRPEQSADQYIRKLQHLIDVARTPSTSASASSCDNSVRGAPTLDRLHGMHDAVSWGYDLRRNLDALAAGTITWADFDTLGCLLSGPPGCGKTLFARALAASCGVPLITGSYAEWLGTGTGHQGDLLRSMRAAFSKAKAAAPAILFIDEVDAFPNRATTRHAQADWAIQVVNALLAEIDGVAGREGVVVIAACNYPHLLDPALVRSGRLDRHIRISLPDQRALGQIFREHLGTELAGESLAQAALLAAGASGADCERVVKMARRHAREAGRPLVLSDLLAVIVGEDRRSPHDQKIAAVHEAGHAVAVCETYPGALKAVTVRGDSEGGGTTRTDFGQSFIKPRDVHTRLVCLLAGRAAEEIVFGAASAGAGGLADSDLGQATALATTAVSAYGFDAVKGLVWSGFPDLVSLPRMLAGDPVLAERVRKCLQDAYDGALMLMRFHRQALEAVAEELVVRQALDGDAVERIIAAYPDVSNEAA